MEKQFHQAQKMEAVGQLTAGIAHDFNNLPTAMNGNAQLLMMKFEGNDAAYRLADAIQQAGLRAADLISHMLAFSRKQNMTPRRVDLNEVVSSSRDLLNRSIGDHIELHEQLSPNLWATHADPAQLEQFIVNLVINGRDAMPDGGTLTLETANVAVEKPLAGEHAEIQKGEYACLTVRDNGHGMSAQTRAHLFEPFFTTKAPGKGTGLGLASVYGIVTQSGGYITVRSQEGAGSSFTVYLPRSEEADAAEPATSAPAGVGQE